MTPDSNTEVRVRVLDRAALMLQARREAAHSYFSEMVLSFKAPRNEPVSEACVTRQIGMRTVAIKYRSSQEKGVAL